MTAASISFYVLLGSMPGLAAVVWLYGTFANPDDVTRLSRALVGILPSEIADLLGRNIQRLADRESATTRSLLSTVAWLLFILWSANRGMRGLVDALNQIYRRAEARSRLIRLALTLAMTLGLVVFLAAAAFAAIVVPVLLDVAGVDGLGAMGAYLRWPAMLLFSGLLIALLLRYGPNRQDAHWPSIVRGSITGAILWLAISVLFAWYVRNVARFDAIYGSLGSVAVFMTWLWLSALAMLVGAEFDAEAVERSKSDVPGQERSGATGGFAIRRP